MHWLVRQVIKKIIDQYLFTTTAIIFMIGAIAFGATAVIGASVTLGLWSVVCAIAGVYFLLFATMLGEI